MYKKTHVKCTETHVTIKWSCMHQIGHYFGSRRSNRNGQFLLPKTNKALFLRSALLDLNENYNKH